jgi:regulation of enolase protein 1 (concanavalin A-like superfamily)
MIRQDDRPGSPAFSYHMTKQALPSRSLEYNLAATSRLAPESDSRFLGPVGPVANKQPNLVLRLQRVGSEIAGFYSRDGSLWVQANFAPQSLASLPEQALFGLAVTSQRQGALAIGQLDQVSVQPGSVSVYGIQACGGDKAVLLQWRPLKNAVGYNVYRGPAGAAREALVKLNAERVAGASFTDNSKGLANGTPATYAVAAIVAGAGGNPVEGPLVALTATPVAAPAGVMGCSINEGLKSGGAAFDPATGEITLRGTGLFVFDTFDQLYFLSQPVEGDAQNTVQARTRPTLVNDWARAGLMIRESLDPGARHLTLWVTRSRGLVVQWRPTSDGNASPEVTAVTHAALRPPITLRLTRRGNTVTPEYSIDDGTTFQPAGRPITFDPPLARMLHVGLAITAAHRSAINSARFSLPEVKKL